MSVIVKNMEMPKNCKECPFSDHEAWCLIPGSWKERYYCPDDERSEHCPLIELPPHGRLIDADKFKADYSMKNDCIECEKELQGSSRSCEYDRIYSKMDFCDWIDIAPTVIEAEGSEE